MFLESLKRLLIRNLAGEIWRASCLYAKKIRLDSLCVITVSAFMWPWRHNDVAPLADTATAEIIHWLVCPQAHTTNLPCTKWHQYRDKYYSVTATSTQPCSPDIDGYLLLYIATWHVRWGDGSTWDKRYLMIYHLLHVIGCQASHLERPHFITCLSLCMFALYLVNSIK